MTRLIIQIPCLNEADSLPAVLADLPRAVAGVDEVRWLVIDDGSTDATVETARRFGADYIVRHRRTRGLAMTFRTGIDACLRLGADIIVNTDGDNQYDARDIPALIQPILDGKADMVIGDRGTDELKHFSAGKRALQRMGSLLVRKLSRTNVPDTVSGFRAFSREAAEQMNIVSSFSHTIETIIQAGRKRLAVASVPIRAKQTGRPSRLFRSVPHFLRQSATTMARAYAMYHPLRVFFYLSLILMAIGSVPIARFLYLYLTGHGSGHVQSLVLGGVFVLMGFVALMIGVVADLISFNRQLLEILLERARRDERREHDRHALARSAATNRTSVPNQT